MVHLQKDTYLSLSNTPPQAGAYSTTTTKPQWDRLQSLNRLVKVNHMYSFLEKHLQNMIKKILIVAAGRDTSPIVYFQKDTILSLSNTPSSWSIQQHPQVKVPCLLYFLGKVFGRLRLLRTSLSLFGLQLGRRFLQGTFCDVEALILLTGALCVVVMGRR